jgi:hypothetical protein
MFLKPWDELLFCTFSAYLDEILIPHLLYVCSYDYSGYGQSSGKVHTFIVLAIILMCMILILYVLPNTAA